jgi:hypothetical protein
MLVSVTRVVLGALLVLFGLNGFLSFLPPPSVGEAAGAFLGGLASAGYFFPVLSGVKVLAGLALLANRFVPLALLVVAPVAVQALLFHLFLDPAGIAPALIVVAGGLVLARAQHAVFAPLLAPRAVAAEAQVERRRAVAA